MEALTGVNTTEIFWNLLKQSNFSIKLNQNIEKSNRNPN